MRISPDSKHVAFAEMLSIDGGAGAVSAVGRSGKAILHVTSMQSVRMTPDGKSYVYWYGREQSDLFIVESVR